MKQAPLKTQKQHQEVECRQCGGLFLQTKLKQHIQDFHEDIPKKQKPKPKPKPKQQKYWFGDMYRKKYVNKNHKRKTQTRGRPKGSEKIKRTSENQDKVNENKLPQNIIQISDGQRIYHMGEQIEQSVKREEQGMKENIDLNMGIKESQQLSISDENNGQQIEILKEQVKRLQAYSQILEDELLRMRRQDKVKCGQIQTLMMELSEFKNTDKNEYMQEQGIYWDQQKQKQQSQKQLMLQ